MAKAKLAQLKAVMRDSVGTRAAIRLRAEGQIPAVIYGHKQDTVAIAVSYDDLDASLRERSRMIELVIGKKKEQSLLKDVQYDAFGSTILHADFERVAMDEKIKLAVPVELKGRPRGASDGGILEQILAQIEVECLPADIPQSLVADVRELEIDDRFMVGDLPVPPGVTIMAGGDTLIAVVSRPKVEREEEEVEAAPTEPEVIGRVAETDEDAEGAGEAKSDQSDKKG